MNRRDFLKFSGIAAGSLIAVPSCFGQKPIEKPNIIIFFLDDSGYGDFEHTGNPTISTPNITRLKQQGTSFSQFYVASPACSASRYSLLTGRYPGRSGLGRWVVGPGHKQYIHSKEVTLAGGLQSKGYATGIFGKWHLGNPNHNNDMAQDSLPLAHGFDVFQGTNVSHDYRDAKLLESCSDSSNPVKGYKTLAENVPSNQELCDNLTNLSTESTLAFIKENKDKPFFAYVPYNMPHLGLHCSDKFKGKSRRGLLGDVMMEIDDGVRRIRKALEDYGLTEKTLIIFTSDNGHWIRFQDTEEHRSYGEARIHIGYAYPFRDGKGSNWEGGHRVPGIFCWPGRIPANKVEQEPISTLDVLPTIFALVGLDLPDDRTIDGRDIRALLDLGGKWDKSEEFKFFYSYNDNKPSAIRKGPWKLHIRIGSQTGDNYGFTASREKPLLFQVERDLSERYDLADKEPEKVKELLADLEKFEKQLAAEGSFWR